MTPSGGALVVGLAVLALAGVLGLALVWAARGAARVGVAARVVGGDSRSSGPPGWFVAAVARLDLPVAPGVLWSVAGPVAVLAGLGAAVQAPVPAVVVLAAVGVVAGAMARRADRRPDRVDAAAVIEALAASLTSGASLAQAVTATRGRDPHAPVTVALAPVAEAVEQGAPAQAALDRWALDVGDRNLTLVVDSLAVAGSSGGSQARALAGVGRTIRERDALAREVRALGSQSRTSAIVLAVTPLAFTAVVAVADQRVAAFLLTTVPGLACLVVGATADVVGWCWMRRLVDGVA
jgi:tight adherence protein B